MNSVQENKNELEAAVRYCESAISRAQATIESMEFRQQAASKAWHEQTGREAALERDVKRLAEEIATLKDQLAEREDKWDEAKTNMALMTDEREMLEKNVQYLRDENERLKGKVEEYTQEYCKLSLGMDDAPTMPLIPKDVAIAIFREGIKQGVYDVCDELDNTCDISIEETEYCGDFEVSFSRCIDLSEHLDLDWIRDKVGAYEEINVVNALVGLCENKGFECRIYGIDNQEEKNND